MTIDAIVCVFCFGLNVGLCIMVVANAMSDARTRAAQEKRFK